jgi:BirA family transcriptional regulator, biotin operon repressor / biotin---[acetyl-CoA-carboxylase] ligase
MTPVFQWLEQADSTNRVAEEMAAQGAQEGTAVVARIQTSGRGREGRIWISPPGGLYLTAVLRPRTGAVPLGWISIAGGIAAAETLRELVGADAQLKWPNDVLIQGLKVGGVLSEARSAETGILVLLGVGLNLTTDPAALPERPLFPAGTVLGQTGVSVASETAARRFMDRLLLWYGTLQASGPAPLQERFGQLCAHAGRRIEVDDGQRRLWGRDAGLAESGALLLDTEDGRIELLSGQILKIL